MPVSGLSHASGKVPPFTNPPFLVICLSHTCQMNTSVISSSSAFCHHDMPGIYPSYKQTVGLVRGSEKIYLVIQTSKIYAKFSKRCCFTKGIFSDPGLHLPVICRAYPCDKSVLFCGMLPANKIMPAIELQFDF